MMRVLRGLWALFSSRYLWTLLGLTALAALIWVFGPLVAVGEARPFATEAVQIAIAAGLFILWLVWLILAQRRAIRANRLFVAEIAAAPGRDAGDAALDAVEAKFRETLAELKRRKLGRRFLREMPWYVIIGPPATGKTTALRQSGLSFPFDIGDDLHGVGGTRNCDWFIAEDAVLIDTAGRYTEQASDPESDAREWLGFLDLLKKHRGRKALNGVIVAIAADTLAESETSIRAHGRVIRKRLVELTERLEIRLPVYLMVTKADLLAGFEPYFADLDTAGREQVWGATFPPGAEIDGGSAAREIGALAGALEPRIVGRLETEERLATRAEIFRFPSQVASLVEPLRLLVDTAFGQSRYETSPWLRGVYLTSATQVGTPIDRLAAALSASFGLPTPPAPPPPRSERRSFFLKDLLSRVVFAEAGLAALDPAAEQRRAWLWRGGALAAAALLVGAGLVFTLAYLGQRGAIDAQARLLERLQTTLAPIAANQAPVEPLDLDAALEALTEIERARVAPPSGFAAALGPSAAAEIRLAQDDAYARGLRNLLEPRMVALLEATMWREIQDPEFLLEGLKAYRMLTGLSQVDPGFLRGFWTDALPSHAPVEPFPTEAAAAHQLAAIDRLARDDAYVAPDEALVARARDAICAIPLAVRAYAALLSDPAATALPEWVPASHAGPNGAKVLVRASGKTLRVGIPGVFTYRGFHDVVLDRFADVAAQAALDRSVFAGGCPESADISVAALAADILKLYYDDYVARWDGFLRDVTLAPMTDIRTASENLRDLAAADSALRRLLTAVVAETDLARVEADQASGGDGGSASKLLSKLGKLGKLAKKGAKLIPVGGDVAAAADTSGQPVSTHFAPIRAAVAEVDGQPPGLDDAQAALAALAAVLQTAAASPDPDAALRRQGGLAELIGAVANQAALLPDPLDDWLVGIAGDFRERQEDAVATQLNAIWRADILPFCRAATAGRYPFDARSSIDVNTADFQRLFGPGGMIDGFVTEHLGPFVDTGGRPWRWRADLGFDDAALAPLEQARRIRDALFPGGAGPILSFTLEPKDLSPSAARVTLNVDGQVLTYFNAATRPAPMTWPGRDGTGVVTLAFAPVDGSPEILASQTGDWAFLRLVRANRLTPTDLPELYRLRLSSGPHVADFDLRAASVENPFDLRMFDRFACPSPDLVRPAARAGAPKPRRRRRGRARARVAPARRGA